MHAAVTEAGDSGVAMVDSYATAIEEEDLDGDGTNDVVIAGSAARWEVEY